MDVDAPSSLQCLRIVGPTLKIGVMRSAMEHTIQLIVEQIGLSDFMTLQRMMGNEEARAMRWEVLSFVM